MKMKRYFYIDVENLNWHLAHPKHVRILQVLGMVFDKHNGFKTNEIIEQRLMAVLNSEKVQRVVIFTLRNIGINISSIKKLTGLNYFQIIRNIKAASKNSETVNDYMFLKYAIFELWL